MAEVVEAIHEARPRRFRPYAAYRESGVEWLSEIPANWNVLPLKRIGGLKAGAGFPDDEQGVTTEEIPFFKVGDMGADGNEREMIESQHTVSAETARRLRAFVFPPGTVVFAKVGAALMLNRRRLIARPSCLDNNMMGFIPGDCDPKWALYWLSGLDMRELANPGAVPSVNEGQMRETPAVVPPLEEQRAIASFLDRETAKIDGLVAKKERVIELLQEKRTALITRAVTQGLDPNVPMKDSGVEWLGKIPAHWEVKRLSWVTKCLDGKRIPLNAEERGRMQGDYPYWGANSVVDYVDRWLFDEELVLLGEDGAPFFDRSRPVAFRVAGKIWVNNHAHVLRPQSTIDVSFLAHVLNCVDYRAFIDGSTRDKLTQGDMNGIPIQCPEKDEQRAIAAFIEGEATKIDALIAKVREAVDRLAEFRTALISAAVTGKIDVREEAA